MLSLRSPSGWRPRVIPTTATTGDGVQQFREALIAHREWSESAGVREERRARRAEAELDRIITARLRARVTALHEAGAWDELVDQVRTQRIDPWSAAETLLD
jgi:putative protein kinase ArgK-like GTPase of G3E family